MVAGMQMTFRFELGPTRHKALAHCVCINAQERVAGFQVPSTNSVRLAA